MKLVDVFWFSERNWSHYGCRSVLSCRSLNCDKIAILISSPSFDFFFRRIDVHAFTHNIYDSFLAKKFVYICSEKRFSQRDSGDNAEIDDNPDFSEHAYAELSRRSHPFNGAANETTKLKSTPDIADFERMLRLLDASEF